MKQNTILFLAELHKRINALYRSHRATFVFAESMDDFCLSIGYASSVAAYDALPQDIKYFVHMSRNKSNPMFYMHVALVATPREVLFVDVADKDSGAKHLMMNIHFDDSTINFLRSKYV